ncbi:MAG: 50S ribosomal protein L32 [Candidatus Uhrbacteria bacterium]|nr:50S ribosomal protein L32 [Candidatus Uhrbacteria bacterium]
MPVPARRHSSSHVRRRRAHDAMKTQNVGLCTTCQAPLVPHTACKNCGTYKGKQVLDVSRDFKRTAKKVASAHDHGHDHEEAPTKSR